MFLSNIIGVRCIARSKCFFRCYPAPRKRFYKSVSITESDGKFEINLDKRKLKTPTGKLVLLPNEALATAVAAEWETQQNVLQQQHMHFTSLCNTAIDKPGQHTTSSLTECILEYLASDTLCYRCEEPPELVSLQRQKWDPILDWFRKKYNVTVTACDDLNSIPVPDDTVAALKKYLLSFNDWSLLGIKFSAENLKSLILALAILNQRIDVEMAVALSRLEVIFQTERWGNVEWSHNLEKSQTTARVAAGTLFTYANEESRTFVEKHS